MFMSEADRCQGPGVVVESYEWLSRMRRYSGTRPKAACEKFAHNFFLRAFHADLYAPSWRPKSFTRGVQGGAGYPPGPLSRVAKSRETCARELIRATRTLVTHL